MAKRKRHGNSSRYFPVRELSKPKFRVSVNDFLALNFPGISSEIISNNVACWFSKNAPNYLDMQTLLQRSIPSPAFLAQIEEAALKLSQKRGRQDDENEE